MNEDDERPPLIWEKGVENFGDEEMMKMMLQNFEPLCLDENLKDLSNAIKNENFSEITSKANILRGSSW